jgi:hypothetical protein
MDDTRSVLTFSDGPLPSGPSDRTLAMEAASLANSKLKQQLQRKLHNAWRVGRCHKAERAIGDVSVGQIELGMVKGIEQFRTEL